MNLSFSFPGSFWPEVRSCWVCRVWETCLMLHEQKRDSHAWDLNLHMQMSFLTACEWKKAQVNSEWNKQVVFVNWKLREGSVCTDSSQRWRRTQGRGQTSSCMAQVWKCHEIIIGCMVFPSWSSYAEIPVIQRCLKKNTQDGRGPVSHKGWFESCGRVNLICQIAINVTFHFSKKDLQRCLSKVLGISTRPLVLLDVVSGVCLSVYWVVIWPVKACIAISLQNFQTCKPAS